MTKKILFSVATSMLLSTSAFAAITVASADTVGVGTLILNGNSTGLVSKEYNDKYSGTGSSSLTGLVYTAGILGSGAVSDSLVRINISDLNLSKTGVNLDAIFDAQRIINSDTNITVATYDKSIVVSGSANPSENGTWVLFAGNSTTSIVSGQKYYVRNDDKNDTSSVTYGFNGVGDTVALDVYSTSGSEERRDYATSTVATTLVNQFTTSCITNFDGLINIEALQDSFTNTNHDNDSGAAAGATDGLSQWDTLVFTVNNARPTLTTPFYMDGNASAFRVQTRYANGNINVDNNFSDNAIWNAQVVVVPQNGVSTPYALAVDATSLTTLAALNLPANANVNGTLHYTTDGNLTFILPDTKIPVGTTTYYFGLGHTARQAGIKPVEFVNARFALEAGLADNNNSIYPAGDTPRGASRDAGKWVNHAFISQIPAGESGGAQELTTRYFITNRSCSVATPQIDVVYNGTVYNATNVAALPIDTQNVYTLKDIMMSIPALATVWNANTSTKVSVEITIPGIAEQFYIYAQVKNKSINQFKDLPVYSTSERD